MPQTEPVLKLIYRSAKVAVSSDFLRTAEVHQQSSALAGLVVEGVLKNGLSVAQLGKTGHVAPAFSTLNLSETLQPLVTNQAEKYVSAGRLMQRLFAHDFSTNEGWENAQKMYKLTLSMAVDKRGISDPEQLDQASQAAIQTKLQRCADAFVRRLIGEHQTLISARLPQPVLNFLIQVDQQFHAQLIQGEKTRELSTEQMREARSSLQANRFVAHLRKPRLEGIATNAGTKTEQCFVDLILKTLSTQVDSLARQILVKSFAQSSPELRERAILKEGAEEQAKRTAQRVTNFKSRLGGHQRSRSADTTPIDPRSMREAARSKRKEKAQDVGDDEDDNNAINNVSLRGADTVNPFSRHGRADKTSKAEPLSAISLLDFEKELADALDEVMILMDASARAMKTKPAQTTTTSTTTAPATPRRVAPTATIGQATPIATTTLTTTNTTTTTSTTPTETTTTASVTNATIQPSSGTTGTRTTTQGTSSKSSQSS